MAIRLSRLYGNDPAYHRDTAYHALGLARWAYNDDVGNDTDIRILLGFPSHTRNQPALQNAPKYLLIRDRVGWQIGIAGTTTLEQWIAYVVQSGTRAVLNMAGITFTAFELWANAIVDGIIAVVQPNDPLFLAGHSLGGAMSILVAGKLKARGYSPRGIYTFGSPRVGDYEFVRNYDCVVHNVLNVGDAVSFMPPSALTTYTRALNPDGIVPELLRPGIDYPLFALPEVHFNPVRAMNFLNPFGQVMEYAGVPARRHLINTYVQALWSLGTYHDHRNAQEWGFIWFNIFDIVLSPEP